jgi:hypothetical protein
MVYIEDITNKPREFTPNNLLEISQDPTLGHIIEKMLNLDPNLYMLKLAQNGSKIPSKFNINTLK